MRGSLVQRLLRFASTRRQPALFLTVLGLLALNLVVPDPLPLLDELALALAVWLSSVPRREPTEVEPREVKNVTPRHEGG